MVYANVFDDVIKAIEDGLYSALRNPSIVLLNIIAFVILVFIVKKFFWQKVTNFIEKRRVVMMEALEAADREKLRAQELQAKSTKDYEAMKNETKLWKEKLTAKLVDAVVTEIISAPKFYPAEDYHQDYYAKNPEQGYCSFVIRPKLKKLGLE